MMRTTFFMILFLVAVVRATGQQSEDYAGTSADEKPKQKVPFRERLTYGGGIGANFGSITFVQLAPQIGYRTTDRWINGIGLNYIYFSDGLGSQSMYGGSVWSRFFIVEGLFASTEFEVINRDTYSFETGWNRRNVPIWMVGLGYFSGGDGLGVGIQVMYDLVEDPWSPYQNPIIRGGIMVGF